MLQISLILLHKQTLLKDPHQQLKHKFLNQTLIRQLGKVCLNIFERHNVE